VDAINVSGAAFLNGVAGIAVARSDHMATKKKTSTRGRARSKSRRTGGKRERLKSRNATFFARRTSTGRFKEMDEQGRSQSVDRRRKAKRRTTSGQGDRGDRRAA